MSDPFGPWSCRATAAGAVARPDGLGGDDWLAAPVPGTVAGALNAAGRWDFDRPADLDASDWWYRTTFRAPEGPACRLCFDGLATLAEVWLNGRHVLSADNMFRGYQAEIGAGLPPVNELAICFRSLSAFLKRKRPRPRWKTRLVADQQVRWCRTGLLGRIPGWSPPAPAVGPWRAVRLDTNPYDLAINRLYAGVEGEDGVVTFRARLRAAPPERATLAVGEHAADLAARPDGDGWLLTGVARVPRPELWWPHTHGAQPLSECALHLELGSERHKVALGAVGFRRLAAPPGGGLAVEVNGVPVYCRGACWTVADILDPGGADEVAARDLRLARDAGANMLRVGGTMHYESDTFYRLCDELGILVWQDFAFANMDYPADDADFAANAEAEARYQLSRLARHPSLAVLCGNSEVEQQAALCGAPAEGWRNTLFSDLLPAACGECAPGVVYVPSSPSGGAMPFHVRDGVAHYYGVGAYLRPVEDVRRADVKFAAECLAFANVPGRATIDAIMGGSLPAVHHPRWKARVPRDGGAGWDFDDVRDFYLAQLFAVDPACLRYSDMPRYLQLSRVVPGEMMARAFAEWRGAYTRNRGALVWFFKDLWPAAGWGVVDRSGTPKAAYYYLRRSWQPRQLALTDEGLEGLHLHATNESAEPLDGSVELLLLKDGHVPVARGEAPCRLPPGGCATFQSDTLLGGFYDAAYAYRFGPAGHDTAVATLFDAERRVLSEAFHFVTPREPAPLSAVDLAAEAEPAGPGCYRVSLRADRFLHAVSFDAPGFVADDDYFHLPPSRVKAVLLRAAGDATTRFRASVEALNLPTPVAIRPKGAL